MKKFIQSWIISTLAVLMAVYIVKGIQYENLLDLLVASFLLGILNDPSARRAAEHSPRGMKTLTLPGALGSTMKVWIASKGVGAPPLLGTSFKIRAT